MNLMSYSKVTVFGGSSPRPGEAPYEQAEQLGRNLAQAGYTVITGGYIGTMEAVSRGAAEAGGYVVGITCDEIEAWRQVGPNFWISEERRYPTLQQRLYALIDACDAAIVLPGGIGTLAEIAVMWSQMQVRAIPVRPLLVIGNAWQKTLSTFLQTLDEYVAETDRQLVQYVPDIAQVVERLKEQIL